MEPRVPTREEMLAALERRQGVDAVRKLQAATVAVCGLGGLGSNIAISLARAGVGKLILIDFDCVDVTNLHRQQYKACQVGLPKPEALLANLKEIAPYTEYETHSEKVTAENAAVLLAKADVVCEAFDVAEAKAMHHARIDAGEVFGRCIRNGGLRQRQFDCDPQGDEAFLCLR